MEITMYNPQKGRLETRDITISEANTTWFDNCLKLDDIYMITDTGSGLLIRENNFNHPVLVYDVTRVEIGNNQQKAKILKEEALTE